MARVGYDSTKAQAAILAEAVDHLIKGRQLLARFHAAADVARGAPADYTKLEGGDFGAIAGQGENLWTIMASVKTLLDGDDAGGLATFLASLDVGG